MIRTIPAHILVAASSWLSRIISALVQVISIRYLIDILGDKGYAAFALLSGLTAWGALIDVGVGNSLQNYISEKRAAKKNYDIYIVLSGFFCFFVILIALLLLWPLSVNLSSHYLRGFSSADIESKEFTFYIAFAIFIFTSFGSILFKIWFAEQKGWLANIIIAISSLLGLLLVYIVYRYEFIKNINLMLIVFFGPVALISTSLFIAKLIKLARQVKYSSSIFKIVLYNLIRRSSGFWFFTFIATIVLQADYIVMSQKLEPKEIITYMIMMKIFGLVSFIYAALLQALWPVCVEYRIRRDWSALNLIVIRYIALGSFFVSACAFLIFSFRVEIISLISNEINSNISWLLVLLFGIYFVLRVWSDTFAMLLQSMNYLFPLWCLVPVQAIISVLFQWNLADKYGVYGMLTGLILSFVFTVVVVLPFAYKHKIRELRKND